MTQHVRRIAIVPALGWLVKQAPAFDTNRRNEYISYEIIQAGRNAS